MTAPARVDRESYDAAIDAVRQQLLVYAAAVWGAANLSDEFIAQLVAVYVPAVKAAQLEVANLTSAYLAAVTNTTPVPVDDVVTRGRGVPDRIVYARPVIQARSLVAEGKPYMEALDAGRRRLESLATTDVQMAKVRQADASLQAAGQTYYRRVPKGDKTCALCLIASTQRYRVGRLMPIHPGCDCDVDVLPPEMNLDEVIDEQLLLATHTKVEEFAGVSDSGGRAVDYRKLIIEHEHGELGAVLAFRDHKFTGPEDLG